MANSNSTTSAHSGKDDVSRPFPELPFITVAGDPNRAACDYFDVTAEDYGEGNQTGIKVAWQLMHALAHQSEHDTLEEFVPSILTAVVEAQGSTGTCSKQGAAVGFLLAMSKILIFTAKNSQWVTALDAALQQEERCALQRFQEVTEVTEANTEFRASMGVAVRPSTNTSNPKGTARALAKGRAAEIRTAAQACNVDTSKRKAAAVAVVAS